MTMALALCRNGMAGHLSAESGQLLGTTIVLCLFLQLSAVPYG
jgi:hypothetical protein